MSQRIFVAHVSDVPPGEGKTVTAEGRELALFNVGEGFRALDGACPHMGGPLGQGILSGETVVCPFHGWSFNVHTGACESVPGLETGCYECVVEGDRVLVVIPDK
jgi:nitrite reductase/ring-hydroxylating ferredoxin subunit